MANELEALTQNAAGDSWVDGIPGAVSTGYQSQNTNIQAAYNGIDSSSISVAGTTATLQPSGPIDDSGILFSVTVAVAFDVTTPGTYYVEVIPGGSWNQRSLQLTQTPPAWHDSKNGYYLAGNRVLSWALVSDGVTVSARRLSRPLAVFGDLAISGSATGNWDFTGVTRLRTDPVTGGQAIANNAFWTPPRGIYNLWGVLNSGGFGNIVLVYGDEGVTKARTFISAGTSQTMVRNLYGFDLGNAVWQRY